MKVDSFCFAPLLSTVRSSTPQESYSSQGGFAVKASCSHSLVSFSCCLHCHEAHQMLQVFKSILTGKWRVKSSLLSKTKLLQLLSFLLTFLQTLQPGFPYIRSCPKHAFPSHSTGLSAPPFFLTCTPPSASASLLKPGFPSTCLALLSLLCLLVL